MNAHRGPSSPTRIVVSGASGVVGGGLIRALLPELPTSVALYGLFRSEKSFAAFRKTCPPQDALRLQPIIGDLTKAQTIKNALDMLAPADVTIGVHCAADVSWEKTFDRLKDLNVSGSHAFAEALSQQAGQTRMIYVSSAYTAPDNWDYRNGYEESKAAAHRMLRDFPVDLQLSVFSCSLVIGDSNTGAIDRFHGIYPLVKTLATGNLPFVVGTVGQLVDLVPVDVVSKELADHVMARLMGHNYGDIVVAAGDRRVKLGDVFGCIEVCLNSFLHSHDYPAKPELTFIPYRRWEFLRRSLKTWQPEELSLSEFRFFERVLAIYRPYIDSDRVLTPLNMSIEIPEMRDVLRKSVDYWLEQHADAILARLRERRDRLSSIPVG